LFARSGLPRTAGGRRPGKPSLAGAAPRFRGYGNASWPDSRDCSGPFVAHRSLGTCGSD